MSIFNSLGSNYRPKHLSHMLTGFDSRKKDELVHFLKERYGANVQLTYKGREALFLALQRANVKEGSHVAINGFTCYAVYDAVNAAGLVPVYIDIPQDELNFTAKELSKHAKKDKKLKAAIIQNTFGTPADLAGIEKVAQKHNLHIIEDLAHSIGMQYEDGREAGATYDAALSFSQDKMVDAVSGGVLLYEGEEQEFKTKRLSYRRFLKDYYYIWNTQFIRSGYIWGGGKIYAYIMRKLHLMPRPMDGAAAKVRRPDTWHASLALWQLKDLHKTIEHRREIAEIYRGLLPKKIQFAHHDESVYLRFPVQVEDRAGLIKHLGYSGIYVSDIWYDAPVSPARNLQDTNYKNGECPQSEKIAKKMINLPTHINVEVEDAERICEKVNEWLSKQE